MELNQTLMQAVIRIAKQAGDEILRVYQSDFSVEQKADDSPLTQADLASHQVISRELQSLTPKTPILSEESKTSPFSEREQWQEYWLIDPLDGTKEFIKRNGEFTVNIAFIRDHQPIFGVVHVPVHEKTYYGSQADGAYKLEQDQPAQTIQCRPRGNGAPTIVGSRSHANPVLEQCLEPLGGYNLVSMGSSLKFCVVAEGGADLYPRLGPTSEWDTAAAHAIVRAAGGDVTLLDGSPLLYNHKDCLLNPFFLVSADPTQNWTSLFKTVAKEAS